MGQEVPTIHYFRMITNHVSQPYDHIVMQSNVDVTQLDSNFQAFSRPQRLHHLKSSQTGLLR